MLGLMVCMADQTLQSVRLKILEIKSWTLTIYWFFLTCGNNSNQYYSYTLFHTNYSPVFSILSALYCFPSVSQPCGQQGLHQLQLPLLHNKSFQPSSVQVCSSGEKIAQKHKWWVQQHSYQEKHTNINSTPLVKYIIENTGSFIHPVDLLGGTASRGNGLKGWESHLRT